LKLYNMLPFLKSSTWITKTKLEQIAILYRFLAFSMNNRKMARQLNGVHIFNKKMLLGFQVARNMGIMLNTVELLLVKSRFTHLMLVLNALNELS